jgi:hypothetical protein
MKREGPGTEAVGGASGADGATTVTGGYGAGPGGGCPAAGAAALGVTPDDIAVTRAGGANSGCPSAGVRAGIAYVCKRPNHRANGNCDHPPAMETTDQSVRIEG